MRPIDNVDGKMLGMETMWGMPLELAVGVIGAAGVLIGALVAAAATISAARWEAKQHLRTERLSKLEDAMSALHGVGMHTMTQPQERGTSRDELRQLLTAAGIALARAKAAGQTHLRRTLLDAIAETTEALRLGRVGKLLQRDAGRLLTRTAELWIADPAGFERRRPSIDEIQATGPLDA